MYCIVPVDYILGWTLPVSLYRFLVSASIIWHASFLPAIFVCAMAMRGGRCLSNWAKGGALLCFAMGSFLGIHGVQQALLAPQLHRLRIQVPGLHGRLTLLHITDIHAGYFQSSADILRLRSLLPETPDFILLTGDQMHNAHVPFLSLLKEALFQLPAKQGKFQVAGNHDHRVGEQVLYEALQSAGVVALDDEHVMMETPAGPLVIAGVDDIHYGGNLARALAGRPEGVPVVLLSHRPEIFPNAAKAGVLLVLAGHTHGGQVCLGSWLCLSDVEEPHWRKGVYRQGNSWMFVSSGLGTTGMPVRLFSPPDVGWIELEGVP